MSHGPVDVFAAKDQKVILIQVKSGKGRMTKSEKEKFAEWGKAFGADAEIWHFDRRKGLSRITVNGSGTPAMIDYNGRSVLAT
jgi:Holliday junction resolvase